jgi:hypothetical protein
MVGISERGRFYGLYKPYPAGQALRCERSLWWTRDQVLAFLGGFGKGRLELRRRAETDSLFTGPAGMTLTAAGKVATFIRLDARARATRRRIYNGR